MSNDYRHFRLVKQCEELADLTPPTGVCSVIIQLDAADEVQRYQVLVPTLCVGTHGFDAPRLFGPHVR